MSEMSESAIKERLEKGWSRWDIMALGADKTLIPNIGDALYKLDKDEYSNSIAQLMRKMREEPDFETLNDERNYLLDQMKEMNLAFDWLASNLEVSFSLEDDNGHKVVPALGSAMVYFGKNTIGFPARGVYGDNSDASYEAWKSDCVKYGTYLANSDFDNAHKTFHWLKEWYGDLWD